MSHTGPNIDKKQHELSEGLSHLLLQIEDIENSILTAQQNIIDTLKNLTGTLSLTNNTHEQFTQVKEKVRLIQEELDKRMQPSSSLNGNPDLANTEPTAPFFSKMSTWKKILTVLEGEEEPLSASTLLTKIAEVDHEVNENEDYRRKITINLFTTLKNKVKTNEIERKKVNGEFVYSLPQGSTE